LEKQAPVKLLLLADLHLGSRLPEWGEYAASRRDALRVAWHEAAELVMNPDEKIDAMIVAGDLFDRRDPGAAELTAVAEELKRVSEAGKQVVICPGAYDGFAGPHSIYESGRLPEVARIVTWGEPRTEHVLIGETPLHLHTFTFWPGRSPEEPFAALSRGEETGFHVGLACRAQADSVEASWGFPVVDSQCFAASELDMVVLGGAHRMEEDLAGHTLIVDPGNPVGLGPGETGDRGWTVATLNDNGITLDRRVRPAPRVLNLELDPVAKRFTNSAAIAKWVRRRSKNAGLIELRLTGSCTHPEPPGRLEAVLAKLPFPVVLRDERTFVVDPEQLAAWIRDASLEGPFLTDLAERRDAAEGPGREALNRALAIGLAFAQCEVDDAD
jgi:DNA repair exonuclease SbcCD nuclease subunit